jgi:hypothetical protein
MGEISQNHERGPKAITSSSAVPKERHSVVLWPPGHALQMNRMLSAQRISAGRGLLGLSRGDLAVVHDIPRRRLRQSSRERPMLGFRHYASSPKLSQPIGSFVTQGARHLTP